MRVLLAPQEIAGYMGRLKLGFEDIGEEARFFDLTATYARYDGADRCASLDLLHRLEKRLPGLPERARRFILAPLEVFVRLRLFLFSLLWADVIIFGFAATYLGGLELPLYKLFKKKLVFIYFGSDSRPSYLNGKFIKGQGALSFDACRRRTARQKRRIRWFDAFADIIIDHPPMALFHEKPFIPFLSIGIPAPEVSALPVTRDLGATCVILHAPSYPEGKGTERIRELVARKQRQGYDLEYVELVGKSNSEVIESLARCSFVFDELYSDTVLAGLGTEAAMLGKPTLVSGYAGDADMGVDSASLPPAFMTTPEDIERVLTILLEHPEDIKIKGAQAQAFVRRKWNRAEVARVMRSTISGDISSLRQVDPYAISYFLGWGVERSELQAYLKQYISLFGSAALQIEDKPRTLKAIVSFASGTAS